MVLRNYGLYLNLVLYVADRVLAQLLIKIDGVEILWLVITLYCSSSGSSNVADRVLAQFLIEIDGVEILWLCPNFVL